ncbi:MAG: amino acid permease [Deltaproteobacteria bacterium]|nr:amino acid permease [Deltaproteobacteria bacterium]
MRFSQRRIGPAAAIAIVLGNIVGVMIFFTPPEVAKHLPWDDWFLAAWVIGGVIALMGAISLAELGAMLPEAGGDYIYIREAYGETLSFLSGWTSAVITFPGSIAAMAVGFCVFLGSELIGAGVNETALRVAFGGWYFSVSWAQFMAIVVILLFTAINHLGVCFATRIQTVLIALPLLLLVSAVGAIFFIKPSGPAPHHLSNIDGNPWLGLFPALIPVFFAYSGWNVITYLAGEVRDPARNIPYSLVVGTLSAIGLYVLICWIYLQGVPAAAMPGVSFLPAVALGRLFGDWTGWYLTSLIALAVLSSINSTVLAGARVSCAMSENGLLFPCLKKLSSSSASPFVALWAQAAMSAFLVLSGEFEQLIGYVAVVMLLFSCLAVGAVLVLRGRRPVAVRPYRAWGYPVTPLVYLVFNLLVVATMLVEASTRTEALWGMAITMTGLPVYWCRNGRRGAGSSSPFIVRFLEKVRTDETGSKSAKGIASLIYTDSSRSIARNAAIKNTVAIHSIGRQ